jgi:hypothetical protein
MGKVEKYLNIAKTAVIKTPHDIDDKILQKLEKLEKEDKLLLDEEFLEYLKKNNSRIYLFNEKVKNNQGKVITAGIIFLGVLFFLLFRFILLKNKSK